VVCPVSTMSYIINYTFILLCLRTLYNMLSPIYLLIIIIIIIIIIIVIAIGYVYIVHIHTVNRERDASP